MIDWYYLTLLAVFCYGVQHFLYKIAAHKKCNTSWVMVAYMLTMSILSCIGIVIAEEKFGNLWYVLLFAVLNAVFFLSSTITRIESLKHVASIIAYPITRMNTVLVIIFSFFYFQDVLSFFQYIGIALAIFVIFLLSNVKKQEKIVEKNFRL